MRPMTTAGALRLLGLGLTLALGACAAPSISPSALQPGSPAASSGLPSASSSATSTLSPTAPPSVQPSPSAQAEVPGQPYDGAAILKAMQTSRRPGGVPDEIETSAVAAAIAGQVWTWGGEPWQAIVAGGSCGAESCTLDVAGTPDGGAGEDLYTFSIALPAADVKLLVADLHGYPATLAPTLNAVARAGLSADRLKGLQLLAARWLPPPKAGQFVLSYRSGGEEGSEALDVVIDLPSRTVLEVRRPTQ